MNYLKINGGSYEKNNQYNLTFHISAQFYAGGITSAAADGIKIAEKIRQKYAPFL